MIRPVSVADTHKNGCCVVEAQMVVKRFFADMVFRCIWSSDTNIRSAFSGIIRKI